MFPSMRHDISAFSEYIRPPYGQPCRSGERSRLLGWKIHGPSRRTGTDPLRTVRVNSAETLTLRD
jgi:hypothetical protein